MNRVLLISEAEVKNQSMIEQNVDSKVLSKIIASVQEVQVRPILGDTLYTSVIDAVYDNIQSSTAIPDATKTLIDDYVVPYLLNAVCVEFVVMNNYKLTNKGTLKLNDNSGSSVASAEIDYIKNYYNNYAATYKDKLVDYLRINTLITTTDVDIDRNVSSEAIGWYLDRDGGCGRNFGYNYGSRYASEYDLYGCNYYYYNRY